MPSDVRILIPNLDKWEDQDTQVAGEGPDTLESACPKSDCNTETRLFEISHNFTIVDFPVNQPRQSGDNFQGKSQDLGSHHLWRRNWKLGFRFSVSFLEGPVN